MRLFTTTALAAVLALPGAAMAQSDTDTATGTDQVTAQAQTAQQGTAQQGAVQQGSGTIDAGRIVALNEWRYDDLYAQGWSAEDFIDDMEVYGENGEEIGDVEDLIVDPDGKLLSLIAEVGGFWDIGDTHISVPWDQVSLNEARDGVVVPVTEENVDEYDAFAYSGLAGSELGQQVSMGVDDADFGRRAFRLTELIGDYARLKGEQVKTDVDEQEAVADEVQPIGAMQNYGYVSDVIIKDGRIAATVVDPASAYGQGYYAYPYYGYDYDYGWEPGDEFYDLPYGEDEVGELGAFEYGDMEANVQTD